MGMKEYIVLVDESILEQDELEWFKEQGAKELIRCKDCKHGQYEGWDNGECVDKTVYCDGYGIHKPDWFCADGEKKSD